MTTDTKPTYTWTIAIDGGGHQTATAAYFKSEDGLTHFKGHDGKTVFAARTASILTIIRGAAGAPETPATTAVQVEVHGSVLTERELRDAVRRGRL